MQNSKSNPEMSKTSVIKVTLVIIVSTFMTLMEVLNVVTTCMTP